MIRQLAHRLMLISAVLAAAFLMEDRVRASSRLDHAHGVFRISSTATRNECWMLELFDQVARQARVPLGFENLRHCWLGPRRLVPADGTVLQASTAREALDEVAAMAPAFRWRDMDGVVVVRPTEAWDDRDDVLNLPAASFQLMNVRVEDALARALLAAAPAVRYDQPRSASVYRPVDVVVSMDFGGGTLLGALNAVVRAKGDGEWRVGYARQQATLMVSAVSRLDNADTVLVRSLSWESLAAALRPTSR